MNTDFCIIGGGMVGLSLANQLLEKDIAKSILIIDKEPELGLHSSGLNSGVLHAGIYYEPKSLKAKVCVEGARRLKDMPKCATFVTTANVQNRVYEKYTV